MCSIGILWFISHSTRYLLCAKVVELYLKHLTRPILDKYKYFFNGRKSNGNLGPKCTAKKKAYAHKNNNANPSETLNKNEWFSQKNCSILTKTKQKQRLTQAHTHTSIVAFFWGVICVCIDKTRTSQQLKLVLCVSMTVQFLIWSFRMIHKKKIQILKMIL